MKNEQRCDNLSEIVYIVKELVLSKTEEQNLISNIANGINTDGYLTIMATRSSEVCSSLFSDKLEEYTINTNDISHHSIV